MAEVTFEMMKSKVKETMEAPTCCAELKAACKAWLESVGTPAQKEKTAALIKELEEDVSTLDHVIPFFESPAGEKALGKDTAAQFAKKARELKAQGATYCFCPACTAGSFLLIHKDAF
ncbi:MAG: hypothetical protein LKE33_05600 [Acidaminococcus sp.]|jgi:hypothetical protein|nr:hypothetical protein [Acidaminococcus sp.]MCI2100658.1 hypothetical protein [Acidaminococcus sp.]MCI2114979.1 hypothetical protein [Acidaminococcus sp.]MCI2117616.1 hypothetical protein [Acidaminococcus sp.]